MSHTSVRSLSGRPLSDRPLTAPLPELNPIIVMAPPDVLVCFADCGWDFPAEPDRGDDGPSFDEWADLAR